MFGDSDYFELIAERLLSIYDLDDVLELNNLTQEEALAVLLEGGYIGHPRSIVDGLETEESED